MHLCNWKFLLISILHAIGAAYSVVLAELMVLIVMLYEVKNELPIIKFFNKYIKEFFYDVHSRLHSWFIF